MPTRSVEHTITVDSSNTTAKRKAFDIRPGHNQAVKRRAARACTACRGRKIRCDITKNEGKCTNCRLDDVECIVVASRRGGTEKHKRPPPSSLPNASKSPVGSGAGIATDAATATPIVATNPSPSVSGHVPVSVTFEGDADKVWNHADKSNDTDHTESHNDSIQSSPGEDTAAVLRSQRLEEHPHLLQYLLPTFLKVPKRLAAEDLNYLEAKGALKTPSPAHRREIFQGYLYAVHPFMPMLDISAFSGAVFESNDECQISLLLFQAVMFAGLHALEPTTIRDLGFSSVKDAREAFYNRVRLLYEFDIEADNAAILQSLILMSNWYGKWDDRKHTWHWTGEAYDVARNMGLHREPAQRFPAKARHFRRRLWWSLYTRDRLIALGTRRPMRIRDDEYDVSLLTLEDFDLEEYARVYSSHPISQSTEEVQALSHMCIQLVKLCVVIGHIVSSQYTVLSTEAELPLTMMVLPRSSPDNETELSQCDAELTTWYESLEHDVKRNASAPAFEDPSSCCTVHWTIIHLVYSTAMNVLHRAQALRSPSPSSDVRRTQSASQAKVRETARDLTKSLRSMLSLDQVRFLGPFGVTALVATSLSHVLDIDADDEDMRDASAFRLSQTLQVLQSLRLGWASADAAVSFITAVTRRAGLIIPMQGASISSADPVHARRVVPKPRTRPERSRGVEDSAILGRDSSGSHTQRRDQEMNERNAQSILQNLMPSTTLLPNAAPLPLVSDLLAAPGQGSAVRDSNTPFTAGSILMPEPYGDQGAEMYSAGTSNIALPGPFWDWNVEGDEGMDLDAMTFGYDFYSNTF
ncbi:Cutinase transcription factor 1 beta [Cyphellophora attinorum]|uniref:Cutinase transcription factor 1 beta n=1 Tax=Cyphellophora attinorum TaxID=1664694 RepID=A0A0N1NZY8_9EURO|nr:Cutinase transcription factor 1 beta [Phialophora attinorum]KPI41815.1 Cutinase transcription factor 1 beta [Phialophora attinorum]